MFIGVPYTSNYFYPNILGAIFIGMAIALLIEFFRNIRFYESVEDIEKTLNVNETKVAIASHLKYFENQYGVFKILKSSLESLI